MKLVLKRTLLPSLMAASLAGITLVPLQPAAADNRVVEDAAIGAGAGILTGVFTRCGSVLDNAAKGAAAGAAVNGANGLRRNTRNRSVVQDVAVGGGAGVLTGAITVVAEDLLTTLSMARVQAQQSISGVITSEEDKTNSQ